MFSLPLYRNTIIQTTLFWSRSGIQYILEWGARGTFSEDSTGVYLGFARGPTCIVNVGHSSSAGRGHFRIVPRNIVVTSMGKADWLLDITSYQLVDRPCTLTSPWCVGKKSVQSHICDLYQLNSLFPGSNFKSAIFKRWDEYHRIPVMISQHCFL